MKIRYVFLLLSLFVLFGCDSDTEKYIKLNEKDLSSFEMLEETKLNGIYSPYKDLHSVLLAQSFYSVDLSKLYSEYIFNNSDSLRNALSELIIKYDSISPSLDSIVAKAHVAYKVPEQFKGDSKAVKAKYRASGKLKEKYFYYNVDSKEISNTSDDIEALLVEAQSKSTNLFLQVLEIKKEINYQ